MKRLISRVRLVSSVVDVSAMIGTRYVDRVRYSGLCIRGISEVKHPFLLVCCVRYVNRKSYADCG